MGGISNTCRGRGGATDWGSFFQFTLLPKVCVSLGRSEMPYYIFAQDNVKIGHGVLPSEWHTLWWAVLEHCCEDSFDGVFFVVVAGVESRTDANTCIKHEAAGRCRKRDTCGNKCLGRVLADKEHLADCPRPLEVVPGDQLIVLNTVTDYKRWLQTR